MNPARTFGLSVVLVLALGALQAYVASAQETGRGWELNYTADVAAERLKQSVVMVETRFDRPRNDDKYLPWAYFRGGRPLIGLYGSAFVYKDPKYVITVPIILENAEYIRVLTWDRKAYPAKLKGKDSDFNVAVLEVDWGKAGPPPPAPLADSDRLSVGEAIAIVGRSEDGRELLSTVGVISAIRKDVPTVEEPTEQYIQFDAAYSLPLTGGPLANVNGEVVGMVAGTVTDFFATNINLAVPINDIVRVADRIIAGKTEKPWFGAETIALTSQIRSLNKIPDRIASGMFVSYVEPGSPADLAGLKPGDMILQLNDTTISRSFDYDAFLRRVEIGDVIRVKYWRFTPGVSDVPTAKEGDIYETIVQILPYPEEEKSSESAGGGSPHHH